jgi:hypothetical protein
MSKQTINIGTSANDGTGDPIRTAFDKANDNFDEVYSFTGWISRFNASTVALTGATNNLITVTGTPESNNGLTLLDTNSRITPLRLNDVITLDFACTVITPSGSNNYVEVGLFVPSGGFYRKITVPLLKGSGVDDFIAVSWTLPVGSVFLANGGDVVIVPNVNLSIKDLYISVTRTHEGQ